MEGKGGGGVGESERDLEFLGGIGGPGDIIRVRWAGFRCRHRAICVARIPHEILARLVSDQEGVVEPRLRDEPTRIHVDLREGVGERERGVGGEGKRERGRETRDDSDTSAP
jgi:hypothetical protein